MALFFASQYRYRLILPMYPFVYVSAGLLLWRLLERAAAMAWHTAVARRATRSEPSAPAPR